jgi:hypothetical protein
MVFLQWRRRHMTMSLQIKMRLDLCNDMFKTKININRHGPRLLPSTRQRLDPPYFSLLTTSRLIEGGSCKLDALLTHRDWNEELQTTRELPRKNLPERLLRERAIFKVHSDFVSAATRGAMAVIDGEYRRCNYNFCGSRSVADLWNFGTDPDPRFHGSDKWIRIPAIFVIDLQDADKKLI